MMGEFCPILNCNGEMHEYFIKVYKDFLSEEYTLESQGFWCPRCKKWFDWKKVERLVEKKS